MPDYCACYGDECSAKERCARYRMVPGEYRQSYFAESPGKDESCDHFWDIEKGVPFELTDGKGGDE